MQIVKQIINSIDDAIAKFNGDIPAIQKQMAADIEVMLKDLELDQRGNIKATAMNLKLIGRIKAKLDQLFRSSGYILKAREYIQSFNVITDLQNKYFNEFGGFRTTALLDEIKKQSIEDVVRRLTGDEISANVTNPIRDLLLRNATTGGSYSQMMNQVRERLITNDSGLGILERYTKQITTDALNQYSAQYTSAVTNDLGLDWFMYTGSLIATSRPFCEACVNKKYIHRSEIQNLLAGSFKEFDEFDGTLSSKTGLPEGMIPGTNASNFFVLRGGYHCGHQLIPVSESSVPINIRMEVYGRMGIRHDERGFRTAA